VPRRQPEATATATEHARSRAELPVIGGGQPATENVKLAAVSGCRAARLLAASSDSRDANHRYADGASLRADHLQARDR